jgi:hypothetical protein
MKMTQFEIDKMKDEIIEFIRENSYSIIYYEDIRNYMTNRGYSEFSVFLSNYGIRDLIERKKVKVTHHRIKSYFGDSGLVSTYNLIREEINQ